MTRPARYNEFPEFLETFNAYSYDIRRADVMLHLILLHQGGIYADLDVECLRPPTPCSPDGAW